MMKADSPPATTIKVKRDANESDDELVGVNSTIAAYGSRS
jgi:hypothetical protein